MTQNQIAYAKLLEDRRSHQATEDINKTRNAQDYELGILGLNETRRANLAKEQENYRSNRARELLTGQQNAETKRANLARESETFRHNTVGEKLDLSKLEESRRHNIMQESQQDYANYTNRYNALEVERSNKAKEAESQRANLAREAETKRSNLANERELARSHRANESLQSSSIGLGYANLTEAQRHNVAMESNATQKVTQDQLFRSLAQIETERTNKAREEETALANRNRELETARHNQMIEGLEGRKISAQETSTKHGVIQGYINAGANVASATARVINSVGGKSNVKFPKQIPFSDW